MAELHFAYSVKNILKRLIFPTCTEQTGWLCTSAAKGVEPGTQLEQILLVITAGLELEITGFQVR